MQLAEMYYRSVHKLFFLKLIQLLMIYWIRIKQKIYFTYSFHPIKRVNMIKIPMEIWDCINTISSGL